MCVLVAATSGLRRTACGLVALGLSGLVCDSHPVVIGKFPAEKTRYSEDGQADHRQHQRTGGTDIRTDRPAPG
jgi:hypothetical protein